MTRHLLFIQGGGEGTHDAWDSKLVENLQHNLGPAYVIRYPRMPDEGNPNFSRWEAAILEELDTLNDGAVLVGHSIGAAILAHTLAEAPLFWPPAGIFLISMPFIGEQGWPSDEIKPKPDLGSKLPPRSSVHLYHGGTDEIVPAKHAALNAEAIPQAAVRILADRDHQLNNDMSEVAADIYTLE